METKNKTNLWATMIVIMLAVSGYLVMTSLQDARKLERDIGQKKALLAKENASLKKRLDSLQELLDEKSAGLDAAQNEKRAVEDELARLRAENDELIASSTKKIGMLKRRYTALRKGVSALEKSGLVKTIRRYVEKETGDDMRKVLEEAASKIERVKSFKAADPGAPPSAVELAPAAKKPEDDINIAAGQSPKEGVVLSVDPRKNLIVVNLGGKDGVKEGYRLKVMKGDNEIAEADVLSARYKIAAAFIDSIKYKYTAKDIKEGCKVLAEER